MRAVLATQPFWSGGCGCFYLDFYYYANGTGVYKLQVGSICLLKSVTIVSDFPQLLLSYL